MNIEEALLYIHKTKWLGTKPGLSRTRRLLGALGDPQKSLKFVHVAGTNGKGSTCAMIASILRESGFCVGLYTSPYITVFNERMQVDGQNITDDELIHIVETIRPAADAMTDDPPTEFEVITAAAMLYFLEKKCDLVVLEVGMGGTLDSTNVIEAPECACSVICAIGLDHTAYLGDTVEKIAAVKAGILKENAPVVMYPEKESVEKVIRSAAKEKHCPLTAPDFSLLSVQNYSLDGIDFSYGALSGSRRHGGQGCFDDAVAPSSRGGALLYRDRAQPPRHDGGGTGAKNPLSRRQSRSVRFDRNGGECRRTKCGKGRRMRRARNAVFFAGGAKRRRRACTLNRLCLPIVEKIVFSQGTNRAIFGFFGEKDTQKGFF